MEFQGHKQQVLQHTEQRVRQLKLKKKKKSNYSLRLSQSLEASSTQY